MHTVPMTRSNLGQCAWLTTECYGRAPMMTAWIRPHPSSFPDHWARVFANRLKQFLISPDQGLRVMVSDDSDAFWDLGAGEQIIGYAAWQRDWGLASTGRAPVKGRAFEWSVQRGWGSGTWFERWALGAEMRYATWLKADTAYDYEALALFIGTLVRTQKKLREVVLAQSPKRGYIYLEECHCTPTLQRRGVGSRLVRQGLEQARAEDVPVCLLASEDGEKLYKKLGFRTVGMAYFGKYSAPAMVWYPESWNVKLPEYFEVDGNQMQAAAGLMA